MFALRIQKKVESEDLHLPELKPLVGQTVEIIVLGNSRNLISPPSDWLPGFWDRVSQGWQGAPLTRPEQGEYDVRDPLR